MRRAQALLSGKHSVLREVGLGTNDPAKAMHMVKETAGAAYQTDRYQNTAFAGAFITRSARGTETAPLAAADDDDLGTLWAYGYAGATNGFQQAGWVQFEVDGSVSDAVNGVPCRIVFKTSDGSGSFSERVRIDKSGNVGIGITPTNKLHVVGNIQLNARGEVRFADADSSHYAGIKSAATVSSSHTYTLPAALPVSNKVLQSTNAGILSWEAAGAGDITSVVAGAGMTGGATSGDATVNVIGGDGITANADDIEITDNGVTLAKMAGLARGKIIYGDASGDPAALAVGDATQVLTTDGTDISWEDASGGGGSGDITSVVAGSGMTGGATSGAATVNVIGGDGITANADEVEATVDGSTIELSASDGSGAIRIKDAGVTYAKIQNVTSTDRILGRDSSGAGVIEEITPANLRTMINVADGATATTDTNTTYSVSCVDGDNSDEEKIRLTAGGSGSGTDDVVLEAGTGLSIARSSDKITFTNTVSDTNTTYSSGDGLDLTGTTFSTDLKSNGGLVIESTELAVDLGASSITGTLAVGDGGSGQTSYTNGQLLVGNTTGNTLAKATLTAGTGISITNGSGAVTITNTVSDTNTFRTVTAGGNTLGAGETLAFTAGTGISIAESAGAVTITNSVTDTNTWRTVTAGGNTLSVSETLAFTAGTGISIAESAGAVTITNSVTDTNTWRGVTAGGNTLGASETLAFTAGTGVSIAESAGAVTITNTVSDTNTTYSAGTLLDLSTTTFNVNLTEAAEAVMANGDYILFLDGGATGSHAKEAIADVATLFAGDGLTASASVMAVNVDDSTIETSSDAIRVKDLGITYAKIQNVSATDRILGRDSASAGPIEEISPASLRTMINVADGATAGGEANEYSFKTISVSGQSDVVADADDDTLTLVAGTNVTITTTADQITFVSADTNTQLTTEAVQDIVGGMIAGNTETRIAVTYEDGDGTLDFVVDDMSGGISHDGSTADGVLTYKDADEATVEANMTFNGNSLAVTTGSASAIPCTIKAASEQTADLLLIENSSSASLVAVEKDGTIELGGSGTGQIKRENVSGEDVAGKILDLRGGKSTGDELGGEIRFSTSPAGSSGTGVNNQAQALVIDGNKVVEFKIAEIDDGTGNDYTYAAKVLKIKVNGTEYFLKLHEEAGGGGGGGGP
jgi:hypothetical protein